MTEIVKVPFSGGEVLTVDIDGQPHVILKPAFESIGIDPDRQIKKVKQQEWARTSVTDVRGSDGRPRAMVTADVRTFLMALATITAARVAESVRPTLVAYQREVADAIEQYWTKGGAINARASVEQLDELRVTIDRTEAQMRVLRLADGLVDSRWLEAKVRHTLARALGEEPEVDPTTRPLSTGEFLEEQGIKGAALRSISPAFGKRVAKLYRARFGQSPPKVERFIEGALRSVNGYTEADRPLFVEAWQQILDATPDN